MLADRRPNKGFILENGVKMALPEQMFISKRLDTKLFILYPTIVAMECVPYAPGFFDCQFFVHVCAEQLVWASAPRFGLAPLRNGSQYVSGASMTCQWMPK